MEFLIIILTCVYRYAGVRTGEPGEAAASPVRFFTLPNFYNIPFFNNIIFSIIT